jgi:hypothetical protein
MIKQTTDDLVDHASIYAGWHDENIISASYKDGIFRGDSFFDGFTVYSRLLNFFVDGEKKLTNGKRSNTKAHNLFDCYEWVVNFGSLKAIEQYGQVAFQRKLLEFRCAGFDDIFIDKMKNYSSGDVPLFRQWVGYNRHFLKRPIKLL